MYILNITMPANFFVSTQYSRYHNLIAAAFHIATITLITMSSVELDWFVISGNVCTPSLTLSQFYRFGYGNYVVNPHGLFVDINTNQTLYYAYFRVRVHWRDDSESHEGVDTAVLYGSHIFVVWIFPSLNHNEKQRLLHD